MARKRQVVKSRVLRIDRCPKRHVRPVLVSSITMESWTDGSERFGIVFDCVPCGRTFIRRGRVDDLPEDQRRFLKRSIRVLATK